MTWTNIQDFGALGDYVADDTAAIQLAINIAPIGGMLYIPRGHYKVSAPISIAAKKLRIVGDNSADGGSCIEGTVAGPLLDMTAPGTSKGTSIEQVQVVNRHPQGVGIRYANFTGGSIRDCQIYGWHAIELPSNTFSILLEQVIVRTLPSWPVGSIGIIGSGHCQILNCDIVGFDEGIRASGATVNITGCRLEVNRTALVLGLNESGQVIALQRSVINGNSFEANDTAIYIRSASDVVFAGLQMQGSVNAPSGQSKLGIDVVAATTNLRFQSVSAVGGYTLAGIRVVGGQNRMRFAQVSAANTLAGKKAWDMRAPLSAVEFEQTNYLFPSAQQRIITRGLAAVDLLSVPVAGKNLRGKAVPVAATLATVPVTFAPGMTAGQAAINTATAQQGAGTLAPGTYYYIATMINEAGETGAFSEKTVTVTAPQNEVKIVGYGSSGLKAKRRVYRGTVNGQYDGYFETDFNAVSFVDVGGPFTGIKSPPSDGGDSETSMQEPDANYAVIVTPSWNTSAWVTGKATSGFIVNFGTPAPAEGGTCDWFIVR